MRTLLPAMVVTLLAVNAAFAQVGLGDLENRDGILYTAQSSEPYSGPVEEPGRMTGVVRDGLRVGEWLWSYQDGTPQFLAEYDSNGVMLKRANWHPNGIQESSLTYRNGRAHGPMTHTDMNGVVRERHSYLNGNQHGTSEIFDHQGNVLIRTDYVEGERHGARVWFYSDGSPRWVTSWRNGERDGTWTQYTRDGTVVMQTTWEEGGLVEREANPHAVH